MFCCQFDQLFLYTLILRKVMQKTISFFQKITGFFQKQNLLDLLILE